MKKSTILLFFLFARAVLPQTQLADFAQSWEIQLRDQSGNPRPFSANDEPLQTLVLTPDVLRSLQSPERNDLGAFNAQGQPLPFALRVLSARIDLPDEPLDLPFFALFGPDQLSLQGLELRPEFEDGILADLLPVEQTQSNRVAGYVIDLEASPRPLRQVELEFNQYLPTSPGHVRFDRSPDLVRWTLIGSRVPIYRLAAQGRVIEQRTLTLYNDLTERYEMKEYRGRYLRLSWISDEAPPFVLTGVKGFEIARRIDPDRVWVELAASSHPMPAGEFLYDAGGALPIDRIQVLLPQPKMLVEAIVFSSDQPRLKWTMALSGPVSYLQQQGQPKITPPFEVPELQDRYWRLHIAPFDSATPPPRLRLGGKPRQLLMLLRGDPPFRLAAGNPQASQAGLEVEGFQEISPVPLDDLPLSSATLVGAPESPSQTAKPQ